MLLPVQFTLNLMCLQTFYLVLNRFVTNRNYDMIIAMVDHSAEGVDELIQLNQELNLNWIIIDYTKYRLSDHVGVNISRLYDHVVPSKVNTFQLFIIGDADVHTSNIIFHTSLSNDKVLIFTKSTKYKQDIIMDFFMNRRKAYIWPTLLTFCNENDTVNFFYTYPMKRGQVVGFDNKRFGNIAQMDLESMFTDKDVKIVTVFNVNKTGYWLQNNSNGNLKHRGKNFWLLNFLSNTLKDKFVIYIESKPDYYTSELNTTVDVYKELYVNISTTTDYLQNEYSHDLTYSVRIKERIHGFFCYESIDITIVIFQRKHNRNTFEIETRILQMGLVIMSLSAIFIFILRVISKKPNVSFPESYLGTLRAIIGCGNGNHSNRFHRSERIFLFSLMIFGLFFNIFFSDNLFAIYMNNFNTDNRKIETIEELVDSSVPIYSEQFLFPTFLHQFG